MDKNYAVLVTVSRFSERCEENTKKFVWKAEE